MGLRVKFIEKRKVFRVGGSVCVPLPKKMRQALGISPGQYVRIYSESEGKIIIEKEEETWDERVSKRD